MWGGVPQKIPTIFKTFFFILMHNQILHDLDTFFHRFFFCEFSTLFFLFLFGAGCAVDDGSWSPKVKKSKKKNILG